MPVTRLCQKSAELSMNRGVRWLLNPHHTHPVFNLIAASYDIVTGQATWHASSARLASRLPPDHGQRVLDLGAGPGNSALAMLDARPDARIVALDRSPAMVQRAR